MMGRTAILLFHMPDYSQEDIIRIFPKSHPYVMPLHCIRDLTREKVAKFFRSTLILKIEERQRLLELATDCFSKFNSDYGISVLKGIEVAAIKEPKDRLMNEIKIGREGWLEEGLLKGRQEGERAGIEAVALRMLEDGMSIAAICRITKLSRSVVNRLEREGGVLENVKKRGRAKKRA